jgi:hypothetical protein
MKEEWSFSCGLFIGLISTLVKRMAVLNYFGKTNIYIIEKQVITRFLPKQVGSIPGF